MEKRERRSMQVEALVVLRAQRSKKLHVWGIRSPCETWLSAGLGNVRAYLEAAGSSVSVPSPTAVPVWWMRCFGSFTDPGWGGCSSEPRLASCVQIGLSAAQSHRPLPTFLSALLSELLRMRSSRQPTSPFNMSQHFICCFSSLWNILHVSLAYFISSNAQLLELPLFLSAAQAIAGQM